jgi:flagellar protein FliL
MKACKESGDTMAAKATTAAAEADEAGGEQEGQPKRKLPLKLIIIAAAALMGVVGVGTGGYFVFSGKKADRPEQAAGPLAKPVAFLDMPDLLVNLASPGGEGKHYLKLKIVLEVPDQALILQIQPLMPRVMDAFQTYLRELRPSDLEGSAGLYRLKEELTRRVNAAIEPARINAVLFKELLVQ